MIYKMTLKDSVDTMTFNLLETPIVDKDIEGAVDNVTLDGNQYTDYLYLKKQYIQKWAIMCPDEYDELRGFYTRQFEEGEVPSYRVYYGANVTRDYTLNGDYFQFNAEGIETGMTLSQLLGNAEQDGTPTPDSPQPISTVTGAQTVVVTGKNILDTSDPHNQSAGGMTATWNNGVVEVRGTNTATSFSLSNNIALPIQIKAGTEISASFVGASVGNTLFRFFNQATNQYESLSVTSPNTSGTYTLTRDADAVRLYKGAVPTNTYKEFSISNWQIELGSTATAYEPYHGQSYEVNLGKNLFDKNGANGKYQATLSITGESIKATATNNNTGYVAIAIPNSNNLLGKSCTISYSAQASVGVARTALYCASSSALASVLGSYIIRKDGNGDQTISFTFPSAYETGANCFVLLLYIQSTSSITAGDYATYSNIQLEAGSQATTFAPYFTPIELAKVGAYQDRIYKDDGKWYIEKQVGKHITTSSDGWGWVANDKRAWTGALTTLIKVPDLNTAVDGLCDRFKASSFSQVNQQENVFAVYTTGTMSFRNTSWTSFDDAQADILGSTVYYALATPTTTEITDETLLYQLNFLASLYKRANNISLVGTGAQGEMEVFIRDVMSVETDVVPEVPVRLTLTDDGVINACGCRRNVQLTMRETTE